MNVYILGAGASKGYCNTKINASMPLQNDFFETYRKLEIAENPYVLIGEIINYLIEEKHIKYSQEFSNYNGNIEDIHSEINNKFISKMNNSNLTLIDYMLEYRAYNQLLFLFNSVINEIQNGSKSILHEKFVKKIKCDDAIITFNWDTLIDRALKNNYKGWNTFTGYYVKPKAVYNDCWNYPKNSTEINAPILLKLHGSTNWITSHIMPNRDGGLRLIQESSPENFYVFENSTKPYPTYESRYFSDYEEFSYGYYPVNVPEKEVLNKGHYKFKIQVNSDPRIKKFPNVNNEGITSMPLIIPPVKNKKYDMFGKLFTELWEKAEDVLKIAENIYVIGYSFPKTDIKTIELFKHAFSQRETMPYITIINPYPTEIVNLFKFELGIDDKHIIVKTMFFNDETIDELF